MPTAALPVVNYIINDLIEINFSYIPFFKDGGIFIPTTDQYALDTRLLVSLQLIQKNETINLEGKVSWITPKNALHHAIPGIGVQFVGVNAQKVNDQIREFLDSSLEIGAYLYGISGGATGNDK